MRSEIQKSLIAFFVLGLSACFEAGDSKITIVDNAIIFDPAPKVTVSWYGPGFYGRKTSNGERFHGKSMTAAGRMLPHGSFVYLRNPSSGKEVVVRLNDRMNNGQKVNGKWINPKYPDRKLDLSPMAARELGVKELGVAEVEVTRVEVPQVMNVQQILDGLYWPHQMPVKLKAGEVLTELFGKASSLFQ